MEYQKITNLLGNICDKNPGFFTKKWIEVHDQSRKTYNTNKSIRFKTSMLRSDLCDCNDAYIVVEGAVTLHAKRGANNIRDRKNRLLAFKNNAAFISCMSKINGVLIENAEDLDIVMPMYVLLKYSKNYSKTSGSLRKYYRDELTDEANDDNGPNKNVINSKSFKYKTSIRGNSYNVVVGTQGYNVNKEGTKKVETAVPLKYLSNFWRTIDLPFINCEMSLALSWSSNCVITSLEKRLVTAAQGDNVAVYDDLSTNATFAITDCKLHVPVVTLSAINDNKLLEQLKTGFKRTVKWKKCRSEMSNQTKNNNLNYLVDPTFTNVNRLFVFII